MATIITGNLLDQPIIAHQCNCRSTKGSGLYRSIADKYPESDIYSRRTVRDTPGTIQVFSKVICMFAQDMPGKNNNDEPRLDWFADCLVEIGRLDISSVAFPYNVGCGLAGGTWSDYEGLINAFAEMYPNIRVSIVKLP